MSSPDRQADTLRQALDRQRQVAEAARETAREIARERQEEREAEQNEQEQ